MNTTKQTHKENYKIQFFLIPWHLTFTFMHSITLEDKLLKDVDTFKNNFTTLILIT